VLEAICRRWPIGRLKVADRGIREGILCELMQIRGTSAPAAAHAPG
jgi:exopolyphosphatase/guanosine-5'-triphosphate,3'-diphosphate pyrophosphatase